MIKFVIGLIALIFVALAVYTYTDKSAVTHNMEKTEVIEKKVKRSVEMAKEVQHVKSKIEKKVLVKPIVLEDKKDLVQNNEQKKVVVDEYGIVHSRYNVNEEQILLEINNKTKIQLDEETIRKIELEIKNSPLSQ